MNICASEARAHSLDACVHKQKLSSYGEASGCGMREEGQCTDQRWGVKMRGGEEGSEIGSISGPGS